jgi:hypothetical protein
MKLPTIDSLPKENEPKERAPVFHVRLRRISEVYTPLRSASRIWRDVKKTRFAQTVGVFAYLLTTSPANFCDAQRERMGFKEITKGLLKHFFQHNGLYQLVY